MLKNEYFTILFTEILDEGIFQRKISQIYWVSHKFRYWEGVTPAIFKKFR